MECAALPHSVCCLGLTHKLTRGSAGAAKPGRQKPPGQRLVWQRRVDVHDCTPYFGPRTPCVIVSSTQPDLNTYAISWLDSPASSSS
jgi:hypothetical protein